MMSSMGLGELLVILVILAGLLGVPLVVGLILWSQRRPHSYGPPPPYPGAPPPQPPPPGRPPST
ncbi:MAG TPA: hypothetical protein VF316_13405 [Polyangiaceae bacterium]